MILFFLYSLLILLFIFSIHFLYLTFKTKDIDVVLNYYLNVLNLNVLNKIFNKFKKNKNKENNDFNNSNSDSVDDDTYTKNTNIDKFTEPFPIKFSDEIGEYEKKVREKIYDKLKKHPPVYEDHGVQKLIVPLESLLFLNYDLNPLVNEEGEITFTIKESPVIAELKKFLIELKEVDETIYESDEELVDAIKALIILSKEYNISLREVTTMFVKKAKEKIEQKKSLDNDDLSLDNNKAVDVNLNNNVIKNSKSNTASESFIKDYENKVKTLEVEKDIFDEVMHEIKNKKENIKDTNKTNSLDINHDKTVNLNKEENTNKNNSKIEENVKKENEEENIESNVKKDNIEDLLDLSAGLEDDLVNSLVEEKNQEIDTEKENIINKTTVMIDDNDLSVLDEEINKQDNKLNNEEIEENKNKELKEKDNIKEDKEEDQEEDQEHNEDYLEELGKLMEIEKGMNNEESNNDEFNDDLLNELKNLEEIKEINNLENNKEEEFNDNLKGNNNNSINILDSREEVIEYLKNKNWQIFEDDVPFNIKKLDSFFIDNFLGNEENQKNLIWNILKHKYLIFNENKTNLFIPHIVIYNALAHMFDINYENIISKFKKMPNALSKKFQDGFLKSFDFIISDLQTNGKKIYINQYVGNEESKVCHNIYGVWLNFNVLKEFINEEENLMDMYRAFPPCYKLKPIAKKTGCSTFLLDPASLEL